MARIRATRKEERRVGRKGENEGGPGEGKKGRREEN